MTAPVKESFKLEYQQHQQQRQQQQQLQYSNKYIHTLSVSQVQSVPAEQKTSQI